MTFRTSTNNLYVNMFAHNKLCFHSISKVINVKNLNTLNFSNFIKIKIIRH